MQVGRRSVAARATADRPVWFPGNEAPEWLDGSLAGDYGFDPIGLGSDEGAHLRLRTLFATRWLAARDRCLQHQTRTEYA